MSSRTLVHNMSRWEGRTHHHRVQPQLETCVSDSNFSSLYTCPGSDHGPWVLIINTFLVSGVEFADTDSVNKGSTVPNQRIFRANPGDSGSFSTSAETPSCSLASGTSATSWNVTWYSSPLMYLFTLPKVPLKYCYSPTFKKIVLRHSSLSWGGWVSLGTSNDAVGSTTKGDGMLYLSTGSSVTISQAFPCSWWLTASSVDFSGLELQTQFTVGSSRSRVTEPE